MTQQQSAQEDGGLAVRVGSRTLGLDQLAWVNRATTTGLILPNVAHELNNALQVIGGLVELLSIRADLPQDVKDKIGRIGAQSGRATELIRELVTFARRDDAGVAQVDVAKLVDRALAFRRYHLARARIAVHVAGAQPGEVLVRADGSSLLQILLNLIINGEQALAGRAGAEIHVHIARTPEGVTVQIRDNGPGPGLQETVKPEPFLTTHPPAAGLGLAVATALAASQGGSLRLQSAPEGGGVAVLTVP